MSLHPVPKPPVRPKKAPRGLKRSRIKTRRVSKRFAARRDPKYAAWIRTLPCFVTWWRFGRYAYGVEAAHVVSRAAGGADYANMVPLLPRYHAEQHTIGIRSFERKYLVNLRDAAQQLAGQYPGGRPVRPQPEKGTRT